MTLITTPAGRFEVGDPDYALVLDVPTSSGSWDCINVAALLNDSAPQRVADPIVIAGAHGTIDDGPSWDTVREVTLRMIINAWTDVDGDPQLSERAGALAAVQWWTDLVGMTGDVEVPSMSLTGAVRVLDVAFPEDHLGHGSELLVRLRLPMGKLTETGS